MSQVIIDDNTLLQTLETEKIVIDQKIAAQVEVTNHESYKEVYDGQERRRIDNHIRALQTLLVVVNKRILAAKSRIAPPPEPKKEEQPAG